MTPHSLESPFTPLSPPCFDIFGEPVLVPAAMDDELFETEESK